jgi:hypothetical protein
MTDRPAVHPLQVRCPVCDEPPGHPCRLRDRFVGAVQVETRTHTDRIWLARWMDGRKDAGMSQWQPN